MSSNILSRFLALRYFIPFTNYDYKGEISNCPICEYADFTIISNIDRNLKLLATAMCNNCGMIYTNPVPTDQELAVFYRDYYRFFYQGALSKPRKKHVLKRKLEAKLRTEMLSEIVPAGSRTLDFGCGSGELVEAMLSEGYDSHGFEIGQAYGSEAAGRLGSRIKVSDWNEVDYQPEFDLITSFQVVEHLRDPLNAVRAMMSWLAPGGVIHLEVPDLATQPCKGFGRFHFAHTLGFNHWSLRLLGAMAGLQTVGEAAPTSITFKRGSDGVDKEQLRQKGLDLSTERFIKRSPYRSYFNYQIGKITGHNR